MARIDVAGGATAGTLDVGSGHLFVSLRDMLGAGAGVAVIDTSDDSVITTIANPMDPTGAHPVLRTMAIDPSTHRVFGGSGDFGTVYTFDGTTNTAGPPIETAGSQVIALAVDSAAHRLYVAIQNGNRGEVTVVDTTNDSIVTSLRLDDMGFITGLALDTATSSLFVCGSRPATFVSVADTIDTGTNATRGAQLDFTVDSSDNAGCGGVPGFAAAVTNAPDTAPTIHALEPADYVLYKAAFVVDAVTVRTSPDVPGRFHVTLLGREAPRTGMGPTIAKEVTLTFDGEALVDPHPVIETLGNATPVTDGFDAYLGGVLVDNVLDDYVTIDVQREDGGIPLGAVYHIRAPLL